jgi:hypothetical protein
MAPHSGHSFVQTQPAFTLLLPELVFWFEQGVVVVGGIRFPSKSEFVQSCLSILLNCVVVMTEPLVADPTPKKLVLLLTLWHHAMTLLSFKVDQLFTLLLPVHVV